MTIDELAVQGNKNKNLNSAERMYNNIFQIRKKIVRDSFIVDYNRHRNLLLVTINGVNFVDDSDSQSSNATWYSMYNTEGKIIWILDNNTSEINDLASIESIIKDKVKAIIIIDNKEKLKEQLKGLSNIIEVSQLKQAVEIAYKIAIKGETVMYSPASAKTQEDKKREEYAQIVYDL